MILREGKTCRSCHRETRAVRKLHNFKYRVIDRDTRREKRTARMREEERKRLSANPFFSSKYFRTASVNGFGFMFLFLSLGGS